MSRAGARSYRKREIIHDSDKKIGLEKQSHNVQDADINRTYQWSGILLKRPIDIKNILSAPRGTIYKFTKTFALRKNLYLKTLSQL